MTEKNVLLGFIIVTIVLFMNTNFLFVGLVTDLLVIAAYLLSKYLYISYKTEGKYLERIYMVPLYIILIMAVLVSGIFSILGRYISVFANKALFSTLAFPIKGYFAAEIFFMAVFVYLLFKTVLVDVLELNLKFEGNNDLKRAPKRKEKTRARAKEEPVAVFESIPEAKPKDELYPYDVKKLPVVVMIDRNE
ncbi:MAG: hypothetical protein KAI53_03925 [Candidatus Aenigmarchaeota archaeon]|nr:hypothetical protein [Candidatus Aenigmarchaeota archaeon]